MKYLPSQLMSFLRERGANHNTAILRRFCITLCLMVAAYSVVFHWIMEYEGQHHSWITGVYWTLTVMSTLGFGDITFTSDMGRLFSILVLISGVIFFLIMLPFTFIQHFYLPWLENQKKDMVPRQLPPSTRDHVIIVGNGPIPLNLADDLRHYGVHNVLLCQDPQTGLDLLEQGYSVAAGDHDDVKTYEKLRAAAAAMLVVLDTDIRCTNIAFTAREAAPRLTIAAGVDNADSSDILRLAGCTRVFEFHNVLGEALARRVLNPAQRAGIMGRFGNLVVAEVPVMHSALAGKKLLDCGLRESTGVNVVGVWDRGVFHLPRPDTVFTHSCVLVIAGTEHQVRALDRLISKPRASREAQPPAVILGGGRVGLSVATHLARRRIPAVIVDRKEHINSKSTPHIRGDASDMAVLERAGIRKTASIIITTHDDDANIYLSIFCRRLRPDAQILCRASLDRNVNGLHSAGADQVLSLASLVSSSIFSLLSPDKLLMINERLSIFRYTIRGSLSGKTLRDCGIRNRTQCSVVAIRSTTGAMYVNPAPGHTFALGDALYLIGDSEGEEKFRKLYGVDHNLGSHDVDLS